MNKYDHSLIEKCNLGKDFANTEEKVKLLEIRELLSHRKITYLELMLSNSATFRE